MNPKFNELAELSIISKRKALPTVLNKIKMSVFR